MASAPDDHGSSEPQSDPSSSVNDLVPAVPGTFPVEQSDNQAVSNSETVSRAENFSEPPAISAAGKDVEVTEAQVAILSSAVPAVLPGSTDGGEVAISQSQADPESTAPVSEGDSAISQSQAEPESTAPVSEGDSAISQSQAEPESTAPVSEGELAISKSQAEPECKVSVPQTEHVETQNSETAGNFSAEIPPADPKLSVVDASSAPEVATVAVGSFQEHTSTEQDFIFRRAFGRYFTREQTSEFKDFYDDGVDCRRILQTKRAVYFDAKTSAPLHSDAIVGSFSIEMEDHMSRFTLELQQKSKNKTADSNADDGWNLDEDRSIIKQTRARRAFLHLNFKAMEAITAISLSQEESAKDDAETQKRINQLTPEMKAVVKEYTTTGRKPILIEMAFDIQHAAIEGVFLGSGDWIKNFAAAALSGHMKLIFHGDEYTVNMIKYMAMYFEHLRQYNPLDRWHKPDKRRVIKLNHLILPEIALESSDTSKDVSGSASPKSKRQARYIYNSRRCYHDWEEFVTVLPIAMATENVINKHKIQEYEKGTKILRLMEVAGSNGRAYFGTLPLPQEDGLRLTQGTVLEITFGAEKDMQEQDAPRMKLEIDEFDAPVPSSKGKEVVKPSHEAKSPKGLAQPLLSRQDILPVPDLTIMPPVTTDVSSGSAFPAPLDDPIYGAQPDEGSDVEDITDDEDSHSDHNNAVEDVTETAPDDVTSNGNTSVNKHKLESGADKSSKPRKPSRNQKDETCWIAHIAGPLSSCPPDQVPLWVTRRWRTKPDGEGKEFDPRKVVVIDGSKFEDFELIQAFSKNQGQPVTIKINDPDQTFRRNLAAIEKLNHCPKRRENTDWNVRMKSAIPGNQIHLHQELDMYEHLRNEFPNPQDFMDLNDDQKAAIDHGRRARQGIQLIQGVGGSGKSTFASEIINLHARSSKDLRVLVVAPSNKAVDSIAVIASAKLEQLKATGKVDKQKYFIRIHSDSAEDQIMKQPASKTRPKHEDARPPTFESDADFYKDLDDARALILDAYKAEQTNLHTGITDKRVQLAKHLSIGYRMLQVSGVLSGSDIEHKDKSVFKDFRSAYEEYATKAEWDAVSRKEFDQQGKILKQWVIDNASAWFSTTTNSSSPILQRAIKDRVDFIIVDEASREREDALMPLFAADLTKSVKLMLMGDIKQLTPTAYGHSDENPFVKQLGISFMARLYGLGFPSVFFRVQHRMVPDISEIANILTYNKELEDAPSVLLKPRPEAEEFRRYVKNYTGKEANVLFIDMKKSRLTQMSYGSGKSRYNDLYLIIMVRMAVELLQKFPDAKIGLLTGYVAQRNNLLAAQTSMRIQQLRGAENLCITTFDAAQAEEYDFVVMDLLVDENSAGFLTDRRRLNVAQTRARSGLIVIGCSDYVKQLRYSQDLDLKEFVRFINRYRLILDETKTLPKCRYYTPGRHAHEDKIWNSPADFDARFRNDADNDNGTKVNDSVSAKGKGLETDQGAWNTEAQDDINTKMYALIAQHRLSNPQDQDLPDDDVMIKAIKLQSKETAEAEATVKALAADHFLVEAVKQKSLEITSMKDWLDNKARVTAAESGEGSSSAASAAATAKGSVLNDASIIDALAPTTSSAQAIPADIEPIAIAPSAAPIVANAADDGWGNSSSTAGGPGAATDTDWNAGGPGLATDTDWNAGDYSAHANQQW